MANILQPPADVFTDNVLFFKSVIKLIGVGYKFSLQGKTEIAKISLQLKVNDFAVVQSPS